jgi:cysteine-rich repeat protein
VSTPQRINRLTSSANVTVSGTEGALTVTVATTAGSSVVVDADAQLVVRQSITGTCEGAGDVVLEGNATLTTANAGDLTVRVRPIAGGLVDVSGAVSRVVLEPAGGTVNVSGGELGMQTLQVGVANTADFIPAPTTFSTFLTANDIVTEGDVEMTLEGRVTSRGSIAFGSREVQLPTVAFVGAPIFVTVGVPATRFHASSFFVENTGLDVSGEDPLHVGSINVLFSSLGSNVVIRADNVSIEGGTITGPELILDGDLSLRSDGLEVDQVTATGLQNTFWNSLGASMAPLTIRCDCPAEEPDCNTNTTVTLCGEFVINGALTIINEAPSNQCGIDVIGECGNSGFRASEINLGSADIIARKNGFTRISNQTTLEVFGGTVNVGNYVGLDGTLLINGEGGTTVTHDVTDLEFHKVERAEDGGVLGLPLENANIEVPASSGGASFVGTHINARRVFTDPESNGSISFDGVLDVLEFDVGQFWSVEGPLVIGQSYRSDRGVPFATVPQETIIRSAFGNPVTFDHVGGDALRDVRVEFGNKLEVTAAGFGGPFDIALNSFELNNGQLSGSEGRFPMDANTFSSVQGCAIRDVGWLGEPLTVPCINLGNNSGITFEPRCGNGQVDPGEVCDDGDGRLTFTTRCNANCLAGPADACGNGVVDPGEECDDGNIGIADGCELDCSAGPVAVGCGDGEVSCPSEQCDDGNTTNGDGCSASCVREEPVPFVWKAGAGNPDPFGADGCGQWESEPGVPRAGDSIVLGSDFSASFVPPVNVRVEAGEATLGGTAAGLLSVEITDGTLIFTDDVTIAGDVLTSLDTSLSGTGTVTLLGNATILGALSVARLALTPVIDAVFTAPRVGPLPDLILGGEQDLEIADSHVVAGDVSFRGTDAAETSPAIFGPALVVRGDLLQDEVIPSGNFTPQFAELALIVEGDATVGPEVQLADLRLESREHTLTLADGRVDRLQIGQSLAFRAGHAVVLGGGGQPTTVVRIGGAGDGIGALDVQDGVAFLPVPRVRSPTGVAL